MSVASWGLSRVLVIFQTFSLVQSEDAYLLFSKPFPWFRVKMLTHFEDFLEL